MRSHYQITSIHLNIDIIRGHCGGYIPLKPNIYLIYGWGRYPTARVDIKNSWGRYPTARVDIKNSWGRCSIYGWVHP